MIKFSIIVPVYNPPEKYLKVCINSLINQTYENIEIILIDNASTGNCPQILKEFSQKDSRIKLIKFKENQGFAGACNMGLNIATGDYIQFVDSDDWIFSNSIKKITNKLIDANMPDLLLIGAAIYDDRNQYLDMNSDSYMWTGIPYYLNNLNFTYNDVKHTIFTSMGEAWSKIYKRDFIIRTNNKFDNDLGSTCVDVFFNFNNYINAKSYAILREKLYIYRINLINSICSGLSKQNCSYINKPILFAQKVEALLDQKKLYYMDAKYPIITVISLLYNLYSNVIHKSNQKLFYYNCQKLFSNTNKNIYTKENILASGKSKWFYSVKKYPFWLYRILSYNLFFSSGNHYIIDLMFLKIKIKKDKNNIDQIMGILDYQNRHILALENKITYLNEQLEDNLRKSKIIINNEVNYNNDKNKNFYHI